MTAQIAAYGRLGSEPVQRLAQSGKAWATSSMAIPAGDGEAPPLWLSVVAFGDLADVLARHAKGDKVSLSGRLNVNRWQDRDGNDREQLQVIADAIVSAKSARVGSRRRRPARDSGGAQ